MHWTPPLGESLGGLFIGVVRGSGNNVQMAPPNHPIHTKRTVMSALQSFYTFIYFTCGLSDGDVCPLLGGPSSNIVTWVFSIGWLPDKDNRGPIMGLRRHGRPRPLP
jgi:hypothetical protein